LSALPGSTPTAEIDNATNKGIIRTALGVSPALVVSDTAPTSPVDGQQWLRPTSEILSIFSTVRGNWIMPYVLGIDSDADAYINAVVAAGATVTSKQRKAINDFIIIGKADGWYSSIKRLYLPIWAAAAPNARCMVSNTSGTFTASGVTHGAGFVQADGTTGYLNTNANATGLIAVDDAMIGGLIYLRGNRTSAAAIGGSALSVNTGQFRMNSLSVITSIFGDETTARDDVALSSANQNGILLVTQKNGTRTTFRRNSSSFSTLKTASIVAAGSIPANSFFFMALGAGGNLKDNSQYGMFFVGSAVSDANKMSDAMKTLWETCTGLTIP
jgi:hypothetical protein